MCHLLLRQTVMDGQTFADLNEPSVPLAASLRLAIACSPVRCTCLVQETPSSCGCCSQQAGAALDTFRVVPGMADTFRELPDTAQTSSAGFMGHPALAGDDGSAVETAAAEPTDYQAALASAIREADRLGGNWKTQ